MNFNGPDEDEEAISPSSTAPLAPEQKKSLYDALLAKYAAASDNSDVETAQKRARATQIGSAIGSLFSGMGSNELRARGVQPSNSDAYFDRLQAGADKNLANAKAARRDKMDQVLTEDKLQWEGKERGRKEGDWGREDATRGREDDPNSMESKTAQGLAKKLMPGQNFDGMSATQLKGSLPSLEKIYSAEQQRLGRIDSINARNQAHQDAVDERNQAREDKKAEKDEQYAASTRIDGLELKDGFRPSPTEASKVKASHQAFTQLNRQMDALDAIYKRSGTNLVGDDAVAQEQIVNDMKSSLKDMQSLGALSGSDYALLEKQLADPTSWSENAKGIIGQDRYEAKGTQFRDSLKNKYESTLESYGYRRAGDSTKDVAGKGTGASGSWGEANAAPSDLVKIQAPDGSIRGVPKDQAEKYVKKGGKVIP